MAGDGNVTFGQWVTCRDCGSRSRVELPGHVEVSFFTKALLAVRCPACGSKRLGMGATLDLPFDRSLRMVPHDATVSDRLADWHATGAPGRSSLAIARFMTGDGHSDDESGDRYPSMTTSADLRRVLLLLDRVPEFRGRLSEMAVLSVPWKLLTERFDDLERAFVREVGCDLLPGPAPVTDDMLRTIAKAGEAA